MWNRFMSSPYAHFITAIALTLGLVLGLLSGHPGKSSMAKFDASAQTAPSHVARPELASHNNFRSERPVTADFDHSLVLRQPDAR
jgi:hypothetical protein